MDQIIIRSATVADCDAIGSLWMELAKYHEDLDNDLPRASLEGDMLYSQRIANRLNDKHTLVYVAELRDEIIGYVLGMVVAGFPDVFVPETSGFIADIYVADQWRGHDVGKRLVRATVERFREEGIEYYEWFVAENNPAAQSFWRSLGGKTIMKRMRARIGE